MLEYVNPKDGPVLPSEEEREVVYARDQQEYKPLRTLRGSASTVPVLSRWSPTEEQRLAIVGGKDIFLKLLTFGRPLQPIQMFVASDEDSDEVMVGLTGSELARTTYDNPDIISMTCRSRIEQQGPWEYREGLDHWEYRANGDRTCSFCGSLHPEDFMQLIKRSAEGEAIEIEPSDKAYKIYVGRPQVKNASEGGIKFYTWHFPSPISAEDQEMFKKAIANTRKSFEETMQRQYPG